MSDMQRRIWLSLGANLGDRGETIREALRRIAVLPETGLLQTAPFYETAPWGKTDQPGFINTAAEVRTGLAPLVLLHELQRIERELGRVRHEHWGARTIDIDMLAAENAVCDTEELRLPHPYLTERAFVLIPLRDIAPQLIVQGNPVAAWCRRDGIAGQRVVPAPELDGPYPLKLIVAMDEARGMGRDGQLLMKLDEDMARFRDHTMGQTIIMGRRTMESLPGGRPLPDRINVVLSSGADAPPGFRVCRDVKQLWQLLGRLRRDEPGRENWCIGGAQTCRTLWPYIGEIRLTCLPGVHGADCFLPDLQGFRLQQEEKGRVCTFQCWRRA